MGSIAQPLRATVNCDMGEGYSLYKMGDDAALMQTIHLANVACGFHASDFTIMDETVRIAKANGVRVGAHPSLPDRQGFGRREMSMEPDELAACFTYQVGALSGFLKQHGLPLNHIKPHGAVYGQIARSPELSRAAARVCLTFRESPSSPPPAIVGLAGTAQQEAAAEAGVPFIAEYSLEGKLLITKKHVPVSIDAVRERVGTLLATGNLTTTAGTQLPLGQGVEEVSICVHSDTPGAVEIAREVKRLVDENNGRIGSKP